MIAVSLAGVGPPSPAPLSAARSFRSASMRNVLTDKTDESARGRAGTPRSGVALAAASVLP